MPKAKQSSVALKRIYRSSQNKVLAGICAGLAEYFNIDPVIVRVIFVVLLIASFGTAALAYLIAWIIIPSK